jgi:hypothetical protein
VTDYVRLKLTIDQLLLLQDALGHRMRDELILHDGSRERCSLTRRRLADRVDRLIASFEKVSKARIAFDASVAALNAEASEDDEWDVDDE